MDPLEHTAEYAATVARSVAELIKQLEKCDDIELLRSGFRVLAVAIPDLVVTPAPAAAVVDTATSAVVGTWP